MTFKNLNALFWNIEKDICGALQNEVAEAVKAEMCTSIRKTFYDTYQPEYYKRREAMSGLIDRRNMESTVSGNVLTVKNITPLDNGRTDYDLDDIIVNGLGNMPFPRDFYSECADKLETTGDHVEAMKRGLKKRGYGVK